MEPRSLVRSERRGAVRAGLRGLVSMPLVALFTLLWIGVPAEAQQTGSVAGQVTQAATGEPLVGAQITVQGTGLGALTNNQGRFVIMNVPSGTQTVRVQFVGWGNAEETVEVQPGESVEVNFELREAAIDVEGLVVTGTPGQARRREVGNSIGQIRSEQIEAQPINNMEQALQGRTAGVTISENSGQVGTGASIRIRGTNSVSGGEGGSRPLVYVDGVRLTRQQPPGDPETNQTISVFDDIAPEDIERIEVIRGPAATTLYGTEASNGVIQIFTKRGTGAGAQWNYSTTQGFHALPWVGPGESSNPSGLGIKRCDLTEGVGARWAAPDCPSSGSYDRKSYINKHNLSVRGGTEDVRFFVSGNWAEEDGVIAPQGAADWGLRGNFGFEPADDFQADFSASYNFRDIDWIPDGNNAEGFLLNVFRGPQGYVAENANLRIMEMQLNSQVQHVTAGLNLTWSPTPNLTQRFKGGVDYFLQEYTEERPFGFFFDELGDRENDTWQNRTLTLDYAGTWTRDLAQDISNSFSWGGQLFQEQTFQVNGFGERFSGPGDKDIDSGSRTEAFEERVEIVEGGAFVQNQIGIWDRFFVTAGVRVDGNSTFGDDFGAQAYPKVSASYMLSDHDFWPSWWNSMKLRTAWGESGSAPGPFDALRTFASIAGDNGQPGVSPSNIGNRDLGPERSQELEVGFEATAFDNRVSVDFTYWDQVTKEALVDVQPIPSQGFTNTQLQNVGRVESEGGELAVDLDVWRGQDVDVSLNGQVGWNDGTVKDIGGLDKIDVGWRQSFVPGERLPVYVGSESQGGCVSNPNAVGEEPRRDVRNNPRLSDQCVLGPSHPTHTFSVGTDITLFQNFTISALGEGQRGHLLNIGEAYQGVRRSLWPADGCFNVQEQINSGNRSQVTAGQLARCGPNTTRFNDHTDPADFFRLRTLSLTWRVPQDLLPTVFSSARLTFAARNVVTLTDFNSDPEALEDGARDFAVFRTVYYNLPLTRQFTWKLNVTH